MVPPFSKKPRTACPSVLSPAFTAGAAAAGAALALFVPLVALAVAELAGAAAAVGAAVKSPNAALNAVMFVHVTMSPALASDGLAGSGFGHMPMNTGVLVP